MKNVIENERGAAAVEFAIVLPVLVMFVFGIIEFGIVFYNKAMVTNACREAARAAIVYRTPILAADEMKNEVDTVVAKYLSDPNNPSMTILIPGNAPLPTVDSAALNTCANPGDELNVTLSWNHSFIMLPDFLADFFSGGLPGTIKIVAITKMRCE
ncbi:MAG: pilus assembly protein [Desulfobacteraceae bacterium]|nr:pilus assembly protein [Desulfobacteraceae bacterium]MDH3955398.1 pilus assembly protein [Desulfobacteraceae bacterium]MDH4010671.1 pilus assembly protein [Desulfobacterales bacterium]